MLLIHDREDVHRHSSWPDDGKEGVLEGRLAPVYGERCTRAQDRHLRVDNGICETVEETKACVWALFVCAHDRSL